MEEIKQIKPPVEVRCGKELKALADETGMYNTISDEAIEQAKGRTYSDYKAMQDPLAGLALPGAFGAGEDDG